MKVFTDQKCSVCDAIGGKGNLKAALDDVGSRLTPDEIRAWIVNPIEMTKKAKAERKPPMRAFPNLAKEDVDGMRPAFAAALRSPISEDRRRRDNRERPALSCPPSV